MLFLGLTEPGSRIDLSIEGMHSQRFGVGVFFLLLLGIVLFAGIIIAVFKGSGDKSVTRTGEKWMFGAIIFGVVVAVVFASLQMLSGVLF
ncbi:MAG: hypothetical protein ABSC32_18760 [Steroidobacteraceae bacterium]|jgi:hypothetical protein